MKIWIFGMFRGAITTISIIVCLIVHGFGLFAISLALQNLVPSDIHDESMVFLFFFPGCAITILIYTLTFTLYIPACYRNFKLSYDVAPL